MKWGRGESQRSRGVPAFPWLSASWSTEMGMSNLMFQPPCLLHHGVCPKTTCPFNLKLQQKQQLMHLTPLASLWRSFLKPYSGHLCFPPLFLSICATHSLPTFRSLSISLLGCAAFRPCREPWDKMNINSTVETPSFAGDQISSRVEKPFVLVR